jgi:hypothetical protein
MYFVIISFEIETVSKEWLKSKFEMVTSLEGLSATVSRMLGVGLGNPAVTKSHWIFHSEPNSSLFEQILVSRLKSGNDVATLTICASASQVQIKPEEIRALVREARVEMLGMGLKISVDNNIYPVTAIVCASGQALDAPAEWLVSSSESKNIFFKQEIVRQLAHRVAIERALLNWLVMGRSRSKISTLFWTPYTNYRISKWPVDLLSDSQGSIADFQKLRSAFNLQAVRQNSIDESKVWWSIAASLIALIALVFPVVSQLTAR